MKYASIKVRPDEDNSIFLALEGIGRDSQAGRQAERRGKSEARRVSKHGTGMNSFYCQ